MKLRVVFYNFAKVPKNLGKYCEKQAAAGIFRSLTCLYHTCVSRQFAAFHHMITTTALHRRVHYNTSPVAYNNYSVAYQRKYIPVTS